MTIISSLVIDHYLTSKLLLSITVMDFVNRVFLVTFALLGVGHRINHRCLLLSRQWGGSCRDHVLPLDPTISELAFNVSLQHRDPVAANLT